MQGVGVFSYWVGIVRVPARGRYLLANTGWKKVFYHYGGVAYGVIIDVERLCLFFRPYEYLRVTIITKFVSMKKVLLFLVAFGCFLTQTQSQTKKEMDKWFNEKAWLGGVQLKPHKTINKQELYRQYHANKSYWDKVFAFLRDNDLKNLSAGRHEIDGDNAYAMVTVAPTKDFDSTHWESHRNYIDVQYVIDGKELIGVHPVAKSTVSKPYNSETDLINYTAKGKTYTATPETFFIFFPTDAHRPGITPGGNETDKKLVIKVKVAK